MSSEEILTQRDIVDDLIDSPSSASTNQNRADTLESTQRFLSNQKSNEKSLSNYSSQSLSALYGHTNKNNNDSIFKSKVKSSDNLNFNANNFNESHNVSINLVQSELEDEEDVHLGNYQVNYDDESNEESQAENTVRSKKSSYIAHNVDSQNNNQAHANEKQKSLSFQASKASLASSLNDTCSDEDDDTNIHSYRNSSSSLNMVKRPSSSLAQANQANLIGLNNNDALDDEYHGNSNLINNANTNTTTTNFRKSSSTSINKSNSMNSMNNSINNGHEIRKSENSSRNSDNDLIKDHLRMLKYELKEKDLDIVQLQKEINELQLENKMLKVKIPLVESQFALHLDEDEKNMDMNNPFIKEMIIFKREKESVVEELIKAQDTIGRLNLEKNTKSIDLYDPNSPDILKKKLKAYEKQVQELEEENEKFANDFSKLEKTLNTYKTENSDLRSKLNESKILVERDESLHLEVANLKNEFKKCIHSNNQLIEENKRLVQELNSRQDVSFTSPLKEGVSAATQTQTPSQYPATSITITTEENDYLIRKYQQLELHQQQQQQILIQQQQQQYSNYGLANISRNPLDCNRNYLSGPAPHNNHLIAKNPIELNNGLDLDNLESSSYLINTNSSDLYQNGKSAKYKLSSNHAQVDHSHSHHNHSHNHHSHHQTNMSNSSDHRNQQNYEQNSNSHTNSSNNYSLSRTDDYLINNFRPFSSTNSQHQQHQQKPTVSFTTQKQPTVSTSSSRAYSSTLGTANGYFHERSQRSATHSAAIDAVNNHSNVSGNNAIYPSRSYISSHQQYNDLNSSSYMSTQQKTLNERSDSNAQFERTRQPSIVERSGSLFSRSNSTANANSIASFNQNYSVGGYDEQDYIMRRDSTASSSSVLKNSGGYIPKPRRYSSTDTLLIDDYSDDNMQDTKGKSLKINVMRDIKSAQKLKSAMSASKYSDLVSSSYSSPTNKSYSQSKSHRYSSKDKENDLNVKRSQTFTSSTIPRSVPKSKSSYTTSYAANADSSLNSTPSNSQLGFYSQYQESENEIDFNRSSVFRSKSADRIGLLEKKFNKENLREESDFSSQNHFQKETLSRKRPFVPLKADDIRIGDSIKFSRPGGKISKGMVKYIGPLPDRNDVYFGLELDAEEGKHDGIYLEKRYFQS